MQNGIIQAKIFLIDILFLIFVYIFKTKKVPIKNTDGIENSGSKASAVIRKNNCFLLSSSSLSFGKISKQSQDTNMSVEYCLNVVAKEINVSFIEKIKQPNNITHLF